MQRVSCFMLRYVLSCYAMLRYVVCFCRVALHYAVLWYAVLCKAMLCYTMPHYASVRNAIIYVMLLYVTLCYSMLTSVRAPDFVPCFTAGFMT